ncbi:carbon-nitrogen hydrolase [Diaporthe helianthi]|uniref:Carbon-nitrogen hydrolase n=1 Tax=Diaporthe helianthi TaxID=158607 RepID=A0A2P5HWP5_DIAHE|nr:carbon-nitrogen hydrolase [Diaporthe helianthi]
MSHNLDQCLRLIKEAAEAGAKVGYAPIPTSILGRFQGYCTCLSSEGRHHSLSALSLIPRLQNRDILLRPFGGLVRATRVKASTVYHIRRDIIAGSYNSEAYRLPIAQAIFFPEASDYIASSPQESLSLARPESECPFVLGLQAAAKEHNIHISAGVHVPTTEPSPPPRASSSSASSAAAATTTTTTTTTKLLNRTIWVLPTGEVDASRGYDKLHLFDYGSLRESAHTRAGTRLVPPFDTPVGRVGSLICFDLRFPEAATALAQPSPPTQQQQQQAGESHQGKEVRWLPAQILTYPSAFTVPTGAAHWETLLRARAIEAQCWVIAAAQVGWHSGRTGTGRISYGGSMVVDPWGRVRCALPAVEETGEEGPFVPHGAVGALGLVDIDLGLWASVRERMPLVRRR